MADINKFKDITDEEIEFLIKERQKRYPTPKKLTREQLAMGLESNTSIFHHNKIVRYVCSVMCFLFVLPNIAKLITMITEYKHYAEILRSVINSNDRFFDFLEKYQFYPVRFTRLMSVQPIPEEFIGLTDEELLAITTKSLFPIKKMVEETRLLEIITIRISDRKVNNYAILLEPKNFQECLNLAKTIVYSIIFYIGVIFGITFLLN